MPEIGETFDMSLVIQPALDFAAGMWASFWPLVALVLAMGVAGTLLGWVSSWWRGVGPGAVHTSEDGSMDSYHMGREKKVNTSKLGKWEDL